MDNFNLRECFKPPEPFNEQTLWPLRKRAADSVSDTRLSVVRQYYRPIDRILCERQWAKNAEKFS